MTTPRLILPPGGSGAAQGYKWQSKLTGADCAFAKHSNPFQPACSAAPDCLLSLVPGIPIALLSQGQLCICSRPHSLPELLSQQTAAVPQDMRPRSVVLAVRSLPTIQEGYEEQDADQLDSLINPRQACAEAYTYDNYLQSICHLAQPTLPLPDLGILTRRSLDAVNLNPRPPHFPKSARVLAPVAQLRSYAVEKRGSQIDLNIYLNTGELEHLDATSEWSWCFPNPLEYLYRHDDPLASSSPGEQCSSRGKESDGSESNGEACSSASVPNFWCLQGTYCKKTYSDLCLQDLSSKRHGRFQTESLPAKQHKALKNKQLNPRSESETGGSVTTRRETFSTCMEKNFMISHWIKDCWGAWREVRVQASMLPAIAEM